MPAVAKKTSDPARNQIQTAALAALSSVRAKNMSVSGVGVGVGGTMGR